MFKLKIIKEITLQPIKRFGFDAAIIFSDILMIPYGLGQEVEFKKNFGPNRDLEIDKLLEIDEENLQKNLSPILISNSDLKRSEDLKKDLIGFVGLLGLYLYMMAKVSPKNGLKTNFFQT